MGPINNTPAVVQIMAWSRPGNKPLSETMMVSLCVTWPQWVNSLAPGRCGCNLKLVILQLISRIDVLSTCEIALRWKKQDLTDDKSALAQVMAWCRQATIQYLSQCWPKSLSPYGATTPHWVKRLLMWPCRLDCFMETASTPDKLVSWTYLRLSSHKQPLLRGTIKYSTP